MKKPVAKKAMQRTARKSAVKGKVRPTRKPVRAKQPPVIQPTDTYNGGRGSLFSAGWRFFLGDPADASGPAFDDSAWRTLDLPHDWSIELPFDPQSPGGGSEAYLNGGTGWYRKSFSAPRSWAGRRVMLGFDGAYMNSRVWINGTLLGERPYGYISFAYDLTPHLNLGGENVIAVRLEHIQPCSRWYAGSGIYRNVWLTALQPVHVDYCGLWVTTPEVSPAGALVKVQVCVRNGSEQTQPVAVKAEILDPAGRRAASLTASPREIPSGGKAEVELDLPVDRPHLWSVDSPSLYTVRAQILAGGRATDVYQTTFGIRTFAFDANEGFSLNGKGMKLNGVCLHHDLGSLGAAVNRRAIERQLGIMKAMGCNAVRTTHNPPEPMLLDLCDRMGLLVIDEAFDIWEEPKSTLDSHSFFAAWAERDLAAMIRRDRNHPCVILYSIGNEIHDILSDSGVAWTSRLAELARAEDSTRPVTHGSNFNEMGTRAAALLDAVGYNYHTYLYDRHHAEYPQWKMYASETSSAVRTRGVYKEPAAARVPPGADFLCSSYDNSVADWGASAEESWKLVNERKFIAGEFIWSGFDYLGEPTPYGWPAKNSYFGIVDTCGFAKDVYYFYQSRWTAPPMVHLLPHWNWTEGEKVTVWAYSNCEEVTLSLNGVPLGSRRFTAGGAAHLEWQVPFQPGILRAEGKRGGRIVARDEIRTAGPAAAVRLTADRPVLGKRRSDLAFVTADIVDAKGVILPDAANLVRFAVGGPGELAGVDNGDPICHEAYTGSERSAFHGKCLAIVRSTGGAGAITLTARSEGLKTGKAGIRVK